VAGEVALEDPGGVAGRRVGLAGVEDDGVEFGAATTAGVCWSRCASTPIT
jgi:hypothetical protein